MERLGKRPKQYGSVGNYLRRFAYQRAMERNPDKPNIEEIYEEIAEASKIRVGMVKQIRKGRQPSFITALRIAKYFNVPVEKLFYIEEESRDL